MEAIEAERCTSIYGTPTMFVDILAAARQKKPDVSHVETGIMAGRGQCLKRRLSECSRRFHNHGEGPY